jgi:hypothetical protein
MNARLIVRWLVSPLLVAPALFALAQQAAPPPPQTPAQDKTAPAAAQDKNAAIPVPLPQGTRIFLKDGNFLLVREYKIEGARVRYWSVERSAWEEIPAQLVDWDATHKGEAEDAVRKKSIDEKLKEIAQHETAASLDLDTSIEAAPGVYLPDEPGFYVVANGAIANLQQDLADSHLSMKRFFVQVITPIPVVPSKRNVEMKGAHAKLRVSDPQPEFYFRTADQREPAVTLVRARVHGGSRQVSEINVNIVGDATTKENRIRLERWLVARGTYRYTVEQKLEPGEYAFIETVPEKGIDMYMWDFGVDAARAPRAKN